MRATRAIIHLDYFKANVLTIKKHIKPQCTICIPVKADAYGHGAISCSIAAIQAGAKFLAVASVQEGSELRSAGIVAPILLLSLPLPEEIPEIIEQELTPLIADEEFVSLLSVETAKRALVYPVHLKVDTGMGRIGCSPEEALPLAKKIQDTRSLRLAGLASHLSVADSTAPEDVQWTKAQISRFSAVCKELEANGISPGIRHIANSGALVLHPEAEFDMVRPGLLAYGYAPIPSMSEIIPVQPVMELESFVVSIKKIAKGQAISYGRTWIAPCDTHIATIPLGYADGLPRSLSGKVSFSIEGRSYPQVGRICMDQCMLDLGPHSDVQRWDRVLIFGPPSAAAGKVGAADSAGGKVGAATGKAGGNAGAANSAAIYNSADSLARSIGGIAYEICCGIHRRVPRVYIS